MAGITAPNKSVVDFKQLTYSAFRCARHDAMDYEKTKPVFERLAAMRPTPKLLFIYCSHDPFVSPPSAELYHAVAGASVAMIDGCSHAVLTEEPEKVLELITKFLAGQSP